MTDTNVHPTQDDGVVRALSELVGGPVGSRAGRARWGTPLALLLLLTAVCFAVGMTSKAACSDRDWHAPTVQYSHLCSSDLPVVYAGYGLDQLTWPWTRDHQSQERYAAPSQPVLVGLWEYAAARVTHVLVGSPDLDPRDDRSTATLATEHDVVHEQAVFTAVNAAGLALVALLVTLALAKAAGRRPWDAAGFAVAPSLALAGLVSWDLLAVAGVACALWAWTRRRPVLVGVCLGVGAAAGVWPVLLLPAFAVRAWRRGRGDAVATDVLPAAVTALFTWGVLNAPAFLSDRERWQVYWHVAAHRGPQAGSFWTILDQAWGIDSGLVTGASDLLMGLWAVGVLVLALTARRSPRVAQVGFLLVAGVGLFGADYRPEQALWLLPLAALARPRWRDLLVWQAGEVFFFAMTWWWMGGELSASGPGAATFYWVAIGVRLVCLGWLVAVVVRDVWWADADPVGEARPRDPEPRPLAAEEPLAPAAPHVMFPGVPASPEPDGPADRPTDRQAEPIS